MTSGDPKRRALGRGLSALLGDEGDDYAQLDRLRSARTVALDQLRPGPWQPRRHIPDDELAELAQSIAAKGILQPLLVRRRADDPGSFDIIAGERRWRAAQLAQLHEVPVLVRDLSDAEALEVALVENLQRQDLSPLEEAAGYRRLMDEFEHTQEELARVVGKSRSHIANSLRLLALPDPVKALIDDGSLTAGHARALITAADPLALAREVVGRDLTVRATEALARSEKPPIPAAKQRPPAVGKDPDTQALERDLSQVLGLAVEIRFRGQGGALILHYQSLDQLDDILLRLNRSDRPGRRPTLLPDQAAAAAATASADWDAASWPDPFADGDDRQADAAAMAIDGLQPPAEAEAEPQATIAADAEAEDTADRRRD